MKNVNTLTANLDKSKTYRATVSGSPEWGVWTLKHNGHTWEALKPGGGVLASVHFWDISN